MSAQPHNTQRAEGGKAITHLHVHAHMAEGHKHTEHPGSVSECCSDLLQHPDTSKWEKLTVFVLPLNLKSRISHRYRY